MNDFPLGYYGPAGAPIRRYIDLMHDALERSSRFSPALPSNRSADARAETLSGRFVLILP